MDISNDWSGAIDPAASDPMYEQIADLIAARIRNHSLAAGTRLPPERQLAELYKVSRTTAINAYRRLEELGLVRTRVGSGTYVAEGHGEAPPPPMPWHQLLAPPLASPLAGILRELVSMDVKGIAVSLATGMPDPRLYPWPAFQALLSGRNLPQLDLGHIATEGLLPLRELLASRHKSPLAPVYTDNVAVVSGSQQGLYLLAKVLLNPGDYVIIESPTYVGALQIFQSAGARILSLPAPGPLQLDLLEDYLIRYRPKMLYVMPTFQNPSGRVLSGAEREALLTLAARHRLAIVEDDPYSELYYDGEAPAALHALDSYGQVIYLKTFSKTVFPGLRIGYIVAPQPVIHRVALEKQYDDLHSNNLAQWLLLRFIDEGLLSEHLATVRAEYRKRRDAMAQALGRYAGGQLNYSVPVGGFYFWCRITRPGATTRTLLAAASRLGVGFVPGNAFYPGSEGDKELRLCFATNDAPRLQEGIKRLAKALAQAGRDGDQSGMGRTPLTPII